MPIVTLADRIGKGVCKTRLRLGLTCEAVLGLSGFALQEPRLGQVVWMNLAGLSLKSGIAYAATKGNNTLIRANLLSDSSHPR